MKRDKLYATVESKDGYFYAYINSYPRCNATGETIKELEKNMEEKVSKCLKFAFHEYEVIFDFDNLLNNLNILDNIKIKPDLDIEDKIKLKELDRLDRKFTIEDNQDKISKVESLLNILDACSIDDENTIFKTEPVYKNTFNGEEREVIKSKIMDLIKYY